MERKQTIMIKKITSILLLFTVTGCLLGAIPVATQNAGEQTVLEIVQGIIDWKKQENGSTNGYLIRADLLELAGTTAGDWFPIGLARLDIEDDYASYLAAITENVQTRYRKTEKLSPSKATEWHRISLAVLASGGDPTAVGTGENGQPIDLIADGTYNRGKTAPLDRQGINGWIWGLIALDAKRYEIPEGSYYTRDDILFEILIQQLPDGGFSLSGTDSDPEVTAMAIQALAPYYNDETTYSFEGEDKTVRQVVEESLTFLCESQIETDDMPGWENQSVETLDQIVIALCSLGIDPLTDGRFIKNGNTLLDSILRYQMEDGGFVHSSTYDAGDADAQSDSMASDQTLCAMAALWRFKNNMRTLYDFRLEQSSAMKERIAALEQKLDTITGDVSRSALEQLISEYYSLPDSERSYVSGYWGLSDAAHKAGVDMEKIASQTEVVESPQDEQGQRSVVVFSQEDKAAVDALPDPPTTEQYLQIVKLLVKLEQAEDFKGKEVYLDKLTAVRDQVLAIQEEIDSLNADILQKLYPIETLSFQDKPMIDDLVKRYNALSAYDQAKIDHWEDVLKAKITVDHSLRGVVIAGVLLAVAAVVGMAVIRRRKAHRHQKEQEMQALSEQYENEE